MKSHRWLLGVLVAVAVAFTFVLTAAEAGDKADAKQSEKAKAEAGDKTAAKQSEEAATVAVAEVGKKAPDFVLTDLEGNEHRLSEYLKAEKRVVLEWFNPDCPFVKKHHQATRSMSETYAAAHEGDVVWLAINSNAPGKQGSGLDRNKKAHKDYKISYPLLLDEDGVVGRLYGAKTTPHMFLIDKDGTLLYDGAIDNAPNTKELGEINYVRKALEACFEGKEIATAKTKPYGCSVKYGKSKAS